MEQSDIQAGRELAGRYRLVSLLGQGGMGSVWKAEHLSLGSDVAVKLIDPAIAQNEQARERFVREARAAAKLRSPHVVQILDYGVDGDVPFIVMEMLRGESLADRLDRLGRLSFEDTARIMSEVARALTRAHEAGVIHRDLKPDNIFLNENDDTEVAKVLDFGVARIEQFSVENAGMTSTGAVLGTPYYMSPEQAEGSKQMDHRTDIWAMAVMTYECIVGVRPFSGETLGALFVSICSRDIPVPSAVAEVPPGFDQWFAKGTSRVVADRFRTAREAAQALRAVCQMGEPERESSLPEGATKADQTLINSANRSAAGRSRFGADARWSGANSRSSGATSTIGISGEEESPVVTSTSGLAHTAIGIPGARPSSLMPLVLGGLVAVGVFIGFYVMAGNDEAKEGEPAPVVAATPVEAEAAADVVESDAAPPPSVPAPKETEVEPEEAEVAEPTPVLQAAPPVPKPVGAPVIRPLPRRAIAPATAPAPAPAPRPAPATRPAPAPKPKRVNLGI